MCWWGVSGLGGDMCLVVKYINIGGTIYKHKYTIHTIHIYTKTTFNLLGPNTACAVAFVNQDTATNNISLCVRPDEGAETEKYVTITRNSTEILIIPSAVWTSP